MHTDTLITTTKTEPDGAYGALVDLGARLRAGVDLLGGTDTWPERRPVLVVLDDALPFADAVHLGRRIAIHARAGATVAVAFAPAAADTAATLHLGTLDVAPAPYGAASSVNPLVADGRIEVLGAGPLEGLRLVATDVTTMQGTGALLARIGNRSAIVEVPIGAGRVVLIGSTQLLRNHLIAAGDNAAIAAWALTGRVDRALVHWVSAWRERTEVHHALPPVIEVDPADFDLSLLPTDVPIGSAAFMRAVARTGRLLPPAVHDALVDFADESHPSGAILLRGVPIGEVPPTPARPTDHTGKDHVSEFVVLSVGRRLGQPVGYAPEHGGDVVQNLLPVQGSTTTQTSTSSGVHLMWHTEAAFHPHRPRFLLLVCLRGDPQAATTLASITEVLPALPLGVRRCLSEPRFRTGIDESYAGGRTTALGDPMPVLFGDPERPQMVFDADLMIGTDTEAADALDHLRDALEASHVSVVLQPGDLLVVDNTVAVHGRTPFAARFDGTDRWLQRSMAVADLGDSAGERTGRVITTRFAAD